MYRYVLILLISYSASFTYTQSFNNAQNSYNKKQYSTSLHNGISMFNSTFENLIKETYQQLPYKNRMISSNHNYYLDIQNSKMQLNTYIEYTFKYTPNITIKNTLIYAFEESSYYSAYIDGMKYLTTPTEMNLFSLDNIKLGSYIWNKDESTVYYVYSFSKQKSIKNIDLIPGLLLKIEFPKKTIYNSSIDLIINQIIQQTQWETLQKLYSIN